MAEGFRAFTSKVVPWGAENVDTDQIVPARYLKVTDKEGLADALFRDWRFEEDGSKKDPPFILDEPGMPGRRILLAGDNFGTGSSREHAPWALRSWGIQAILSTSFADIFKSNSLKNGVLPIVVDPATHQRLFDLIAADPDAELRVDLAEQGMLLPGRQHDRLRRRPVQQDDAHGRHRRDRLPPGQGRRDRRVGGHAPAARRHPHRDRRRSTAGCPSAAREQPARRTPRRASAIPSILPR